MAKPGCAHAHSKWAITLGNTGELLPGLGMGNCISGQYVLYRRLFIMSLINIVEFLSDEHKTMNRAENHTRSAIISSTMSVQTTVSHELRRGKG